MRSTNPVLSEKAFGGVERTYDGAVMTIGGTVNKALLLFIMVAFSASYTWFMYSKSMSAATVYPWIFGGMIGGLITAIITIFKKEWAPVTAPIYAFMEGLLLGGFSALFEARFPGIVIQAVGLTFGTLFSLLFAYKIGVIKATDNFKRGVLAATGGTL